MLRIPTRCEGVRLGPVDDIQAGHREAGSPRQLAHDLAKPRLLVRPQLSRAVCLERELVAVPVDEPVHHDREHERDDGELAASDQPSDGNEDGAERREQREGLQGVAERVSHDLNWFSVLCRASRRVPQSTGSRAGRPSWNIVPCRYETAVKPVWRTRVGRLAAPDAPTLAPVARPTRGPACRAPRRRPCATVR